MRCVVSVCFSFLPMEFVLSFGKLVRVFPLIMEFRNLPRLCLTACFFPSFLPGTQRILSNPSLSSSHGKFSFPFESYCFSSVCCCYFVPPSRFIIHLSCLLSLSLPRLFFFSALFLSSSMFALGFALSLPLGFPVLHSLLQFILNLKSRF